MRNSIVRPAVFAFALVMMAAGHQARAEFYLITDDQANKIFQYNSTTNTLSTYVVGSQPNGVPFGLAKDPTNNNIYFSSLGTGTLYQINSSNGTITTLPSGNPPQSPTFPGDNYPGYIAVNQVGTSGSAFVFANDFLNNKVFTSTQSGTNIAGFNVQTGTSNPTLQNPTGLAVLTTGSTTSTIYVASSAVGHGAIYSYPVTTSGSSATIGAPTLVTNDSSLNQVAGLAAHSFSFTRGSANYSVTEVFASNFGAGTITEWQSWSVNGGATTTAVYTFAPSNLSAPAGITIDNTSTFGSSTAAFTLDIVNNGNKNVGQLSVTDTFGSPGNLSVTSASGSSLTTLVGGFNDPLEIIDYGQIAPPTPGVPPLFPFSIPTGDAPSAPEPASIVLLGLGGLTLAARRLRLRRE